MMFMIYMLMLLALVAGLSVVVVRATLQSQGLLPGDPNRPDLFERRLQRLEEAVDTITADVQRMEEGQRFLTQVMTDRKQLAAGSSAGGAEGGGNPGRGGFNHAGTESDAGSAASSGEAPPVEPRPGTTGAG